MLKVKINIIISFKLKFKFRVPNYYVCAVSGHIEGVHYQDRFWPLIVLGSLMFIPGSYHTYFAYKVPLLVISLNHQILHKNAGPGIFLNFCGINFGIFFPALSGGETGKKFFLLIQKLRLGFPKGFP